MNLYKEYKNGFHQMKFESINGKHERNSDFSEMYIFGKFDTFCKRLSKVD